MYEPFIVTLEDIDCMDVMAGVKAASPQAMEQLLDIASVIALRKKEERRLLAVGRPTDDPELVWVGVELNHALMWVDRLHDELVRRPERALAASQALASSPAGSTTPPILA